MYNRLDKKSKMHLIILSIFYYGYYFFNMYLVYRLLYQYQYLYYILFWSTYLILHIIQFILSRRTKQGLQLSLCDFFLLGSVYIFFSNQIPCTFRGIIKIKFYVSIIPYVIIQSFLIFDIGIVSTSQTDIESYIIIIAFIVFICYFLLAGYVFILHFDQSVYHRNVLGVFEFFMAYFIQSVLFGMKDSFGIHLSYYIYPTLLISIIIVVFTQNYKEKSKVMFLLILGFYTQVPSWNTLNPSQKKMLAIVFYVNTYLRISLLVAYGNLSQLQLGDQIFAISWLCAILFSIITIILSLKRIKNDIMGVSVIYVLNQLDLQKAISAIQKKRRFLKQINLHFMNQLLTDESSQSSLLSYHRLLSNDASENCQSEICQLYQQLYEQFSYQLQYGVQIIQFNEPELQICVFHICDLLSRVLMLPCLLLDQLTDRHLRQINQQKFLTIIVKRLENGLGLTEVGETQLLFLKRFIVEERKDQIFNFFNGIKSQYLSIMVFNNNISQYSPVLPAQILYDLYQ